MHKAAFGSSINDMMGWRPRLAGASQVESSPKLWRRQERSRIKNFLINRELHNEVVTAFLDRASCAQSHSRLPEYVFEVIPCIHRFYFNVCVPLRLAANLPPSAGGLPGVDKLLASWWVGDLQGQVDPTIPALSRSIVRCARHQLGQSLPTCALATSARWNFFISARVVPLAAIRAIITMTS